MEDKFYIEFPVTEALEKSEQGAKGRFVRGYASTEAIDKQKEQVIQKGIDFSPLQKSGFLNWDHQKEILSNGIYAPFIIGYPTEVMMKSKGLWAECELLNPSPEEIAQFKRAHLANEAWFLANSLQKSGTRSLAYSVEGGVTQRRGSKIVKSIVTALALTWKPVNGEATVEAIAKSFCCGKCSPDHPQYNPAHSCHNKAVEIPDGIPFLAKAMEAVMSTDSAGALLKQNLDRQLSSVLYGDKADDHYDKNTGRFHNGLKGAIDHMTNCLGYPQQQVVGFLRKIIHGADKNADLSALVKTAGFVRQ